MIARVQPPFRRLVLSAAMALAAGRSSAAAADAAPDFNRDIRPILAENCFSCHGQDANKRQADLRLDDRAAAVESRALVPGDPGASTALERVRSTDPDVVMPPPSSNRSLTADQKALLERWVAAGAEYSPHWAFVPPLRPDPPPLRRADWPRNDIDRFVLAKLDAAGLAPSAEAWRHCSASRSGDGVKFPKVTRLPWELERHRRALLGQSLPESFEAAFRQACQAGDLPPEDPSDRMSVKSMQAWRQLDAARDALERAPRAAARH